MLLIYNKKEKLVRKKNEYKWKNINNVIIKKKKEKSLFNMHIKGLKFYLFLAYLA